MLPEKIHAKYGSINKFIPEKHKSFWKHTGSSCGYGFNEWILGCFTKHWIRPLLVVWNRQLESWWAALWIQTAVPMVRGCLMIMGWRAPARCEYPPVGSLYKGDISNRYPLYTVKVILWGWLLRDPPSPRGFPTICPMKERHDSLATSAAGRHLTRGSWDFPIFWGFSGCWKIYHLARLSNEKRAPGWLGYIGAAVLCTSHVMSHH